MSRASLRVKAEAIVRDAWRAFKISGDPADAEIAKAIAEVAAQPDASAKPRLKLKPSHEARKRKAFKRCMRLDAVAPILAQIRNIGR